MGIVLYDSRRIFRALACGQHGMLRLNITRMHRRRAQLNGTWRAFFVLSARAFSDTHSTLALAPPLAATACGPQRRHGIRLTWVFLGQRVLFIT